MIITIIIVVVIIIITIIISQCCNISGLSESQWILVATIWKWIHKYC